MTPEGFCQIQARVDDCAARAGRPGGARLIAVSKFQPLEKLDAAHVAGCSCFGENYVQEMVEKARARATFEWHFIGHLQRNKVKLVLPYAALIHSVDSLELAQEINKRSEQHGKCCRILIEVNLGLERSKSGINIDQLPELADAMMELPHLDLQGLMVIPPPGPPDAARPYFAKLRDLRDQLEVRVGKKLPDLSMGMSQDFEVAIEEGATWVRIGTLIFGSRPG